MSQAQSEWRCPECGLPVEAGKARATHVRTTHNKHLWYRCASCAYEVTGHRLRDLFKHIEHNHGTDTLEVPVVILKTQEEVDRVAAAKKGTHKRLRASETCSAPQRKRKRGSGRKQAACGTERVVQSVAGGQAIRVSVTTATVTAAEAAVTPSSVVAVPSEQSPAGGRPMPELEPLEPLAETTGATPGASETTRFPQVAHLPDGTIYMRCACGIEIRIPGPVREQRLDSDMMHQF